MDQAKKATDNLSAPPDDNNVPASSLPPKADNIGDDAVTPGIGRLRRFAFAMSASLVIISMSLEWSNVVKWVGAVPEISVERLEKLKKEINELENAEQYALIAEVEGWYECLTCLTGHIYLYPSQIWKYGVTRKGMSNRYKSEYLTSNKLTYIVQFKGNYAECLIEEKRKIYSYPIYPENLNRPIDSRLVYPPGNTQDN